MLQTLFQPVRLHPSQSGHRQASWLELFFDLVYVATIIELGHTLSDNVSQAGVIGFAALFAPIWWSWTGMTFYFNRFETNDPLHRVLVFAQMIAVASLAIHIHAGLGAGAAGFALSYVAVRTLLVVLYLRVRAQVPAARGLATRYATGFTIGALVWLISAFVPDPLRYGLWALGLAVDFYATLAPSTRRLQAGLPPHTHHLPERFGLFTIIVLGESFLKVVGNLAGQDLSLTAVAVGVLGLAVAFSLWWVYFDDVDGSAVRDAASAGQVWIYAHLPLQLGLTALGVGVIKLIPLETITEPGEHAGSALAGAAQALAAPVPAGVTPQYLWLFCGAVALCLVTIAVIDLTTTRAESAAAERSRATARVIGAVLVLIVAALWSGPFAGQATALLPVLLVAVVSLAQVAIDLALRVGSPQAEPGH